jgi:hypothetical protein
MRLLSTSTRYLTPWRYFGSRHASCANAVRRSTRRVCLVIETGQRPMRSTPITLSNMGALGVRGLCRNWALNNYWRMHSPIGAKNAQFLLAIDGASRNMTANRAVAAILIASLAGCSSAPRHGAVIFIRPSGSKGDRQPDGRVSDRWSRRGLSLGR